MTTSPCRRRPASRERRQGFGQSAAEARGRTARAKERALKIKSCEVEELHVTHPVIAGGENVDEELAL